MEENETQVQEEVVEQEELTTTEETTEDEETQDDVVTLSGEEKAEFEKWKAKKEQRQRFAEQANKSPKLNKDTFSVSQEKLERIELRQDGYTKEEVDAIMELGGAKALSNPLVRGAIETMRSKAKSDNEKQSLSSKAPIFKKYTKEDFNKMSSAEMEKLISQG